VVEFDRHQHATISPDFSLAQPFSLAGTVVARPAQCSGVSAFLECDAPAEIYVELQPDADGAPRSGAPLAKSNVQLAPPQKGAAPSWTFAAFSGPAELTVDTPYWVVVKAVRGSARLGLRTGAAAATSPLRFGSALINRGGERWKGLVSARESAGSAGTPVTALIGVVYVPGPDNQTAAVQLLLRDGAAEQRFDPSGQAATVVLGVPADSRRQATLVIRSHARGLLTVANVVQEYRVS
jgi:hypothetical protein